MAIGTVIFNQGTTSENTYQLEIDEKGIVYVLRNFKGNSNRQGRVPSGWCLEQVFGQKVLCIDFGQNWTVLPTQEAWDEIKAIYENK